MGRFDVLPRLAPTALNPLAQAQSNQTQQPVPAVLGGGTGPIEGRPPGATWAHQSFTQFPPAVAYVATQQGARTNTAYNPQVASNFNSGINPATPIPLKFHPNMPMQNVNSVWTFNGTIPPKLVLGKYSEPILFRHLNGLAGRCDAEQRLRPQHHQHPRAQRTPRRGERRLYRRVLLPGPFYDYHWPIKLAGFTSINTGATDPRAGTPNGSGGLTNIPGDWRETMSTHWFHDHMFSFTSQNVYKGNAAMFNIYSGLDRGNESIADGVNLRLPCGTSKIVGQPGV